MKLRNKKTGEIVPASNVVVGIGKDGKWYDSVAELNKDWEDAPEEPEGYWGIDYWCCLTGGIDEFPYDNDDIDEFNKSIGNYFETKEEAEKAIEKLKAWKRLKDKHFKFDDYDILNQTVTWLVSREYDQYEDDIKLLFGGEE